ncbi:MAG: hypothetical protein ACJ79E_20325, partial [Anaeromyxobacteraceae bacterium]
MSSRLALAAAAAAALLGAHLASAQVAPTPVATATFATVDSLTRGYNSVKIAGLPQGDTQPVVVTVTASTGAATDGLAAGLLQNCEQLALLAMTKP